MLSAKQIAPGETGSIEVSVKTQGLTAVRKTVIVSTNDPQRPQLTLNLNAAVEPEFSLSDRAVYFGSVPSGQSVVKELYVTIPPDKNVKVLSAESTDQFVSVRLESVSGTGEKKVKLVMVQKADARPGYHFGTVLLKTTSALNPEIRIPVRGIVRAAAQN